MKFNRVIKEYNTRFTTKPAASGDTDLSPSADYGSFTSATIIPKEVSNGYEEEKSGVIDDNSWKRAKNKFSKMNWEQPEPNDSDFSASDVQDVANFEMARLNHNKSNYKKAYKKHEIPDDKSTSRLVKMDDKVNQGDPLMWKYYKMFHRPKNRAKN